MLNRLGDQKFSRRHKNCHGRQRLSSDKRSTDLFTDISMFSDDQSLGSICLTIHNLH